MVTPPIPNQKLAASWGASVAENVNANAVTGAGVMRFPGGTATVPDQPPPFRGSSIPAPWTVVPYMTSAGSWYIRVYAGQCVWRGDGELYPMSFSDELDGGWDFTRSSEDAYSGVPSYVIPASGLPPSFTIHVFAAVTSDGDAESWGLKCTPGAGAAAENGDLTSVAIASVQMTDGDDSEDNTAAVPVIRQLPAPGVIIFGGAGTPLLFDLRLNADGDQEVYIPSALRGSAVRFNDENCYNANTGLTSDDWQQMGGTVSVSVKWNNSNNRYEWVFGTVTGAVVTVTIGTASNPLRHGAVNISMFGADGSSLEPYHVGTTVKKPHVFQLLDFYEGTTASPASYDIVIRDNGGPNVDYITPADLAADIGDNIVNNIVTQKLIEELDDYSYWQPHVNRSGDPGTYYVGDPTNPNAWTDLASAIASVISDSTPVDLKDALASIVQRLDAVENRVSILEGN